jgi:hypothetical protein
MIGDAKSQQFADEVQRVADGKLACTCGNRDWRQFIFVCASADCYMAGCKQCGTCYRYDHGTWREFARPPQQQKP